MSSEYQKTLIRLGHAVRELRTKEKISQMALAERADLSLTFVSEIERGKIGVSFETIQKLSGAFGMLSSEFLKRAGF